jgi:methyl-galactoside transport system substrate-binding protein
LLLLPCFLIGCDSRKMKVGLLLYNQADPFVNAFAGQIQEEADESIEIEVFDSHNSQIIQNEYIENMIRRKPDLIILNPVDRLGVYPIIRKLKDENIPVILFNREPLPKDMDLWEKAYYVGARAEQSGQMQAELIMGLFGGDPNHLNGYDLNGDNRIQTVILKGEQGHQDAEIRTSEVVRSFKGAGFDQDILVTEVANWRRDEAYEKMDKILEQYGDEVEVILSNNDAMALGAIDRMLEGKVEHWIPVVGIDGLEEAVAQIHAGYLYGTVLNDSRAQAEAIVDLAKAILLGEDLSDLPFPLEDGKYIWIDYQSFTLE